MKTIQPTDIPLTDRLYRIEEIRHIESQAKAQQPTPTLMQRAGLAAAKFAQTLLSPIQANQTGQILILAGPGDNGGDAFECATQLAHLRPDLRHALYLLQLGDRQRYSADAQASLHLAEQAGIQIIEPAFLLETKNKWQLIIDGLFGIGLSKTLTEPFVSLIQSINQLAETQQIPILALDVPSGLDANMGCIVGQTEKHPAPAICANFTLTFIGNKPGLHTAAGKNLAGSVSVDALGIDPSLFPATSLCLNNPDLFSSALKPRALDSHKGSYGDVMIVGGADGMQGAALLSGRTALHCGAGRVHVAFLSSSIPFDALNPELMCRPAKEQKFDRDVIVIGPGLGQSEEAEQVLRKVLADAQKLVIDADALNLIAEDQSLMTQVRARKARDAFTMVTPHPLEAARLLNCTVAEIQTKRLQMAQTLADQLQVTVILKGAGSIIAAPQATVINLGSTSSSSVTSINLSGNPALATAGTGDVLTGVCAALLAQGVPLNDAARLAVWLHGIAADRLVASGIGPIGIAASEFIPMIRASLNQLIAHKR